MSRSDEVRAGGAGRFGGASGSSSTSSQGVPPIPVAAVVLRAGLDGYERGPLGATGLE